MSALQVFGPDIWLSEGPIVEGAIGFRYPTRMVVLRLASAGLVIWSPVRLDIAFQQALATLGNVAHVIAPNSLHHVFLSEWQQAYPSARFHAAPGLREKRADIRFDTELGDTLPADWAGQIRQVIFHGNIITTEVVFFHEASATAIFADLLQHLPQGFYGGWRAIVAQMDLMTSPRPEVPRKFRLAFRDRDAARQAARTIMGWPVERLVMAHGAPHSSGGSAAIIQAFRWLM